MHCGPIRHTINMGNAPGGAFDRRLIVHQTDHVAAPADELLIQDVFRDLVADDARTALIAAHVANAVELGRNCLVLTQWRTHLESLCRQLTAHGLEPLVLRGGLGKRARADALARLNDPANRPFVLLATGSYIGEGFDCPALDALFLGASEEVSVLVRMSLSSGGSFSTAGRACVSAVPIDGYPPGDRVTDGNGDVARAESEVLDRNLIVASGRCASRRRFVAG